MRKNKCGKDGRMKRGKKKNCKGRLTKTTQHLNGDALYAESLHQSGSSSEAMLLKDKSC